eukprot:TRINITY_DN7652_c0_g1_i2.p2 TRINITY_DN7652_c0_g1~~TRINITY_DN7652_c0_g1_i2.p2  ORF type:complete len:108 (-),score=3.63 TRINITY_DN7652_c0_g1_i2:167-490(-)
MDGAKPNATLTTQDVQKTTFTKYTKNPQQRTSLNSSETTSKTRTIEHPYAYAHHRNERDGRGRGSRPPLPHTHPHSQTKRRLRATRDRTATKAENKKNHPPMQYGFG